MLDSADASSNIAFLRPVYPILDGKASNIIIYIYIYAKYRAKENLSKWYTEYE